MENRNTYNKAFTDAFGIGAEKLPGLKYQDIPEWDSVGHMELIANLEDTFDIMLETDDIVDFSSYEQGESILKKYNIEL